MHGDPEGANAGVQGGIQQAAGDVEQASLVTVPLRDDHNVAGFVCRRSGKVTGFLKKQAAEWQRQRLSRVFVVENPKKASEIWAYYTLSCSALVTATMDPRHTKGYPSKIPMAHLGYMGRDDNAPLKGAGPGLLLDMAFRVIRSRDDMDAWGIWLNAEKEALVGWYTKMGFERVVPDPRKPGDAPKAMYAKPEWLVKT